MFWHFWILRRHHLLKNILNICFWAFIGFGFYLLFLADERFQPYPRFQAGMAFLSVVAMFLPYLVFHFTTLHERFYTGAVIYFELLVATPLILNGIGARWFYDMSDQYDVFVHFVNSFFLAFLAASVIWFFWDPVIDRMPALLFVGVVVGMFLSGILFEAFEAFSDAYWKTAMWGDGHANIVQDTVQDILANTTGAFVASLVFFLGAHRKLDIFIKAHA